MTRRRVWARRVHLVALTLRLAVLALLAIVALATTPMFPAVSFTHGHPTTYTGDLPHDR